MLEHGGRLRAAAQQYGVPLEQWIDLSTGISPWLYALCRSDRSAGGWLGAGLSDARRCTGYGRQHRAADPESG